jgi:hypothetical protein
MHVAQQCTVHPAEIENVPERIHTYTVVSPAAGAPLLRRAGNQLSGSVKMPGPYARRSPESDETISQ